MQPSQELVDAVNREKVLRARRTPPIEKLLDGPRLFDFACSWVVAGVRAQNPSATESAVRDLLRRRLTLQDRLENAQ